MVERGEKMSNDEKKEKVYVRTEKKPSWLERHGFMFGSKPSGEIKQLKMHELGVNVLTDGKLEGRMKALMSFKAAFMKNIENDDLSKYVDNLENRVQLLNDAIVEIAAPYARAGTSHRFAVLMRGWAKWFALAKTGILEVKSWVREAQQTPKQEESSLSLTDRSSINIRNDVHYLHNFLNLTVFRDGFFALSLCFMDQDVSERAATVIQSMVNPQKPREDMTHEPDF
jgi:hypothetical protein